MCLKMAPNIVVYNNFIVPCPQNLTGLIFLDLHIKKKNPISNTHHNITHQCGPLEYTSEMIGAQFKSKSIFAAFRASRCYITRVHKMRVEHRVMLRFFSIMHAMDLSKTLVTIPMYIVLAQTIHKYGGHTAIFGNTKNHLFSFSNVVENEAHFNLECMQKVELQIARSQTKTEWKRHEKQQGQNKATTLVQRGIRVFCMNQ